MNKVYQLYLYSTNYSAENKREVYEGAMGVFSSLEEAENALAKFCASEKFKYESVDEDFIDNLRVISFQIREEPLNICNPNCTENIYIYDANGKLVEQQHGRGWADTTPFKGRPNQIVRSIRARLYMPKHMAISYVNWLSLFSSRYHLIRQPKQTPHTRTMSIWFIPPRANTAVCVQMNYIQ